jgi:16S rRNA G966 N2-methylase RsmD
VDRDRAACATIRQNLTLAGFQERAHVLCLPVERALESALGGEGPYSLVLIDPPYEDESALVVVERLAASPVLGRDSTLVLEHAWRRPPPDEFGPLKLVARRRHGDTGVSIYR